MKLNQDRNNPYMYLISSIPDSAYSAMEKHEATLGALKELFKGEAFKEPKAPTFKTDPLYFAKINKSFFNCLPISWILRDRRNINHELDAALAKPWGQTISDEDIGRMVMKYYAREGRPTMSWLAQEFLRKLAPAFDAYRADLQPCALQDADDNIPEGYVARSFARFQVFGICPISFYDDRLCQSAFGIDAETVTRRIANEVPYVTVLPVRARQGVLIQAVEDYMDVATFLPIRARVMAAIRGTATR